MKKADFIVILVILIIAAGLYGINEYRSQTDNELYVEVHMKGQLMGSYPLSQDYEETFESDLGFNHMVIKEGQVTISDADCLDLICVHTKAATKKGDAIVCVPNEFMIEITGEGAFIDEISY